MAVSLEAILVDTKGVLYIVGCEGYGTSLPPPEKSGLKRSLVLTQSESSSLTSPR
jgi:hypothetical protein